MSEFKFSIDSFGLWRRILVKNRVYKALIVRFVIGRYGRDNIGFMWTIVEPMMLCVGVMIIWSLTKGVGYHGGSIVAFVFTGYMPLTLWRHQTGYMVNIGKSTKFLTIFHDLNVMDAILSRLFLEYFSVTAASLVVFASLYSFDLLDFPYSLSEVVKGWLLMGVICSCSGILFAALSELSHIMERINAPLQYFILPFSGCFFMVEWLPDSVKKYALYIPLVNAYEILRGGFYGPEFPTYGDSVYVIICSILTAGLGFFIFERVKNRIDA
ncbi:ABC transporter permease [Bosea sp. AAP35]|uniref:ABC transporter permease n=1 Tax=Bosea sp. AAP35 TaxID=1523417 RepID=UPI0018D0BCB7|nr:ABC transporter permease [Bosea sp. AAP35]